MAEFGVRQQAVDGRQIGLLRPRMDCDPATHAEVQRSAVHHDRTLWLSPAGLLPWPARWRVSMSSSNTTTRRRRTARPDRPDELTSAVCGHRHQYLITHTVPFKSLICLKRSTSQNSTATVLPVRPRGSGLPQSIGHHHAVGQSGQGVVRSAVRRVGAAGAGETRYRRDARARRRAAEARPEDW